MEDSVEETLTFCDFLSEYWTRIQANNAIERFKREIRHHTRVVANIFGRKLCADVGLRMAAPRGWHPVGRQEVYEYEAFRGDSGKLMTSLSQSPQTIMLITLDGTGYFYLWSFLKIMRLASQKFEL